MSEAVTILVTENTETITQTIVENGETITLTVNEAARGPAGAAASSDVAAAIHAATAVTTLVGTEEVGHVTAGTLALGKIVWNNIKTWILNGITSFPGFGTNHTTAAYGDHLHSGTYDPAGSAAVVSNAVVKPQMTVTGSLSPDATGYLYYAGVYDGYAHWTSDGVAYSGATANQKVLYHPGGDWVYLMYSAEASTIYQARVASSTAATPDGLTFVPQTGTGDPTITADGPLSSAQPAATPSVRALGTGALEAMPGNTAVLLATGATAGATSQAQAFTNGVNAPTVAASAVAGAAITVKGNTATASGTNQPGGNVVIEATPGTGTGASTITLRTGRTLTTGSTLQTPTDAVTILGSGNVGIGTASPTAKLDIVGGINTTSNIVIHTPNGGNPKITWWDDNVTSWGWNMVSGDFRLVYSGSTSRIAIKNTTGAVGIGTTSPLALLSINGGCHVGGDSDPGDNNLAVDGTSKDGAFTVGTLPATAGAGMVTGARCYVTDSNATLAAGIGATVAAGGSYIVPVFYNGANWIIG